MFVMIAGLIAQLINIYSWVLVVYIFMSWVPNLQASSIGEFLGRICEPFLSPFRRIIPPIGGVLDLSPIIAFLALQLATRGIYEIAYFLQ